ncbi:hypothetical protein BaRGS_00002113 [Batillaria attramentaria]|uniref:Uncharacterized protein n=1 Tax=Batillaria attramentaria TaxID=370345 RepID=A0ABD0M5B5_9CAEN
MANRVESTLVHVHAVQNVSSVGGLGSKHGLHNMLIASRWKASHGHYCYSRRPQKRQKYLLCSHFNLLKRKSLKGDRKADEVLEHFKDLPLARIHLQVLDLSQNRMTIHQGGFPRKLYPRSLITFSTIKSQVGLQRQQSRAAVKVAEFLLATLPARHQQNASGLLAVCKNRQIPAHSRKTVFLVCS